MIPLALSKVNQNKGVRLSENLACPGGHCPMHTGLSSLKTIKGISSLVVGMPECTFYSRMVIDEKDNSPEEKHYVYVIDNQEAIFGCGENVGKSIEIMSREGARYIFLIKTCIPSLIGEDFLEIEKREDGFPKVYVADTAHFKRNGHYAGFHEVAKAIVFFLQERKEDNAAPRQINLWGLGQEKEDYLLRQCLAKGGYELKECNLSMSMEGYEGAQEGTLNLIFSYRFASVKEAMKERFGMESICFFDIYDEETLRGRYEEVAKLTGCSELLTSMEVFKKELITQSKEREWLGENTILISSQDVVTLSMAYGFLIQGINISEIHVEEMDQVQMFWREKLLDAGYDPKVIYYGTKPSEKSRSEIILGETQENMREKKGTCRSLSRMQMMKIQNVTGYTRINLMRECLKELWEKQDKEGLYGTFDKET